MIVKNLFVNLIESREHSTDGMLESSYSIEVSYDPGDGTTIKHRTKDSAYHMPGQTDPIMSIAGYHVLNGWVIAERMYRDREKKMELGPAPEAIKQWLVDSATPTNTDVVGVYDDPNFTPGPGPVTPHQFLEAGD